MDLEGIKRCFVPTASQRFFLDIVKNFVKLQLLELEKVLRNSRIAVL